jgi:uncharacterized protein YebE (UPF0316 family)
MAELNNLIQSNQLLCFLIPFFIFVAKVIDCTLSTLSIIFMTKGNKVLSSLFSFLEITIYLTAFSLMVENSFDLKYTIPFILGFVSGNYIGMVISEKITKYSEGMKKLMKAYFVVLYTVD